MKLILFGTGPFAVPTFTNLIHSDHEILALVTRPIVDAGKRRKTAENPTRDLGESTGLKIFDPPNVNADEFVATLNELSADLYVVCDYGQILSRACLGAARLGGINLHGSLLPKYRGAAPINWAIYHGDTETGVTIIHMTPRLDGGPTLAVAAMPIGSTTTTAELEPDLAKLGVEPVLNSLELLSKWDGASPIGQPQDQSRATKAPRLQKSDGEIDWSRTAKQIVDQVRAFQPWPGTFTLWKAEHLKEPLRLIVHRASVVSPSLLEPRSAHDFVPGQAVPSSKDQLWVQTGAGVLSIDLIQPAGKRVMESGEFLRGHRPVELG